MYIHQCVGILSSRLTIDRSTITSHSRRILKGYSKLYAELGQLYRSTWVHGLINLLQLRCAQVHPFNRKSWTVKAQKSVASANLSPSFYILLHVLMFAYLICNRAFVPPVVHVAPTWIDSVRETGRPDRRTSLLHSEDFLSQRSGWCAYFVPDWCNVETILIDRLKLGSHFLNKRDRQTFHPLFSTSASPRFFFSSLSSPQPRSTTSCASQLYRLEPLSYATRMYSSSATILDFDMFWVWW